MKLRRITLVVAILMLTSIGFMSPAQADETPNGPVFTAMNTSETLPDGIWFRNSPHTADTDRVTGHGPYMGERLQLRCYAWGDSVGPYNDTLWYKALDVSRPINAGVENSGFINAHYVDDGQNANVVDAGVPDCSAPSAAPSVSLAQGPSAPAGYRYAITLDHFAAGSSVSITCYDSVSPGGFYTFSLSTDGSGHASTASYCYSGDGPDHWLTAGGVESNHVTWGTGSSGGGGSTGGGSVSGTDTFISGIDVGQPMNDRHSWGPCDVQDFDGGPSGRLIVSFTNGTYIVKAGMLWGWFDYGGAPGAGCPTEYEHTVGAQQRQSFTSGTLYWANGMGHARQLPTASNHSAGVVTGNWSGAVATSGTKQATLDGSTIAYNIPAVVCGSGENSTTAVWNGIGGAKAGGDDTLYQAGTDSGCANGAPQYLPWVEIEQNQVAILNYKGSKNLPHAVAANDLMNITIRVVRSNGRYVTQFNIADKGPTYTWSQQFNLPYYASTPATHSSECIVERPRTPSSSLPYARLSSFGEVGLTCSYWQNNKASSVDATGRPAQFRLYEITSSNNQLLADARSDGQGQGRVIDTWVAGA